MKSIDGINLRNATASLGNAVTRKSQPRRTIASGYVSAVQSDVSGKITTATVQIAGSGSVRAQVPFGANVYTGMGVQIENHGSPSAASWAIAGSSYLPTGTSGGTIINQNGNVIGMFESIWVQDDGFIIAGGLEDPDGDITGPRTMLTQDGFFGWDSYNRESFGIWVRDIGERLAGDMIMGYDDGGRVELSAQNRSFGIWNAGEVILLFDQATGNRITKNLWVGDEAGPQVGIGQFGDAAVIVARNKGSGTMGDIGNEPVFMVSTYEDGDDGGVFVHIGDPDHSSSYIYYDSATPGELIVDADMHARSITIFGEGLIAEGGYIATHDDNTLAGLKMTDRYLEGTGTGGDRTFLLVGAAISLPRHPLLPVHGNINWVGGDGYWGDILHSNFRILRGDKVGLFNGDTPLVWADYAGNAYFDGNIYARGGSFTGPVTIDSTGSLTFGTGGEGTLNSQGVALASNSAGGPAELNSFKFTLGGEPIGGLYGYHDVAQTNLFTLMQADSSGVPGEWDAYTLVYALGGTAKEARVTMAAQGNVDAYSTVGVEAHSRATGDASVAITGGLDLGQIVKTTNFNVGYTGSTLHRIHYIIDATGGNVTGTLPALSAVQAGRTYIFSRKDGTGNVATVARSGSDTIGGATSITLAQYETAILVGYPSGAVWYRVS